MKPYVVTVSRSYGSGGRTIGLMLAEQMGMRYHDRDLLRIASDESGIHELLFAQADEKVRKTRLFASKTGGRYTGKVIAPGDSGFTTDENLFNLQAKTIRELADAGNCVIVGRCANFILRDRPDVIRVFVHADLEACIRNVVEKYAVSRKEARRRILRLDGDQSGYYRYYTGQTYDNAKGYDICLDSSRLGFQKCVDIIKGYMEIRSI